MFTEIQPHSDMGLDIFVVLVLKESKVWRVMRKKLKLFIEKKR